jgi:RHS repeat-associated protein
MSSSFGLLKWRTSLRARLVACIAVGLTCQAALAPLAAASTALPSGADRSSSGPSAAPSAGTVPARTAPAMAAKESAPRPEDSVPELWTPRAIVLADTSPPVGAQALFDGDATTGFTSEAGRTAGVRLELGASREVMGLGVHGTGRAKVNLYAEDDKGALKQIGTVGDGTFNLESDRWAQVAAARPTKTSVLVVHWTASATAPAALTELALWVAGPARASMTEAAIADRLVTELPDNAVAANALPWSASVARVTATGPVSASFDVKLNSEPLLGRTFLVYEVEKKAHWTGVARSINGHVVRGGYRAEAKGLGGVQVEEINAAWLRKGDNSIKFEPALTEDGHGYSIRNVRVVSVPRGVDPGPAPGAATPLSDADLSTGLGGPGAHTASVAASADREPAFLSFYLDKPARGTLTVSAEGGPTRAKRAGKVSVELDGRAAGWQTVPVAGLPKSSALRLRVVGDRETTAQVSEARVQPFPAVATPADLTVSYPLHGECHDHKTYVRGFASGADRLQKPQLFVDGQPLLGKVDADGSFEAHVQEPASAKGKPWSIRLEVATADGGRRMRTVPVDTCIEPPKKRIIGVSPPVEDVGAPYGAVVSPAKASTLEFAGAKIEIPAGAVDSDVRVTMRALDRAQVPPVQAETDNVTANGGALRFGPHGLKFKRAVKVTLPVDAARMPPGMTNGDVVTLFFDEASGKWTQLPKVSGHPDRTVGQTNHFTDFIAATIKTPEHPDAQQFNPNTMKGVKAGEPGAGITMIQPPVANSSGSASLSYPIETPPARNGIGPSLALTYDSERVNSNGWLGVGWDLKMSSIEIDTRFGVPKYDGTDIYSLDGAMLTPTSGGKYKKRVEGSFDLIERWGPTGVGAGDPTTYYWKVTDKNGTVYTYGSASTTFKSRLANPRTQAPQNPYMAPQGAIFRWYLEKVQDTYGNVMTITYQHDNTLSLQGSTEKVDSVYPLVIDYTSHVNTTNQTDLPANYHVEFKLNDANLMNQPTRPDVTINARPGFVEVTRRRLADILVKSGTTVVRDYKFEYQSNLTDTLQKSVLSAVALWSSDTAASTELYRHTFEYLKAPAANTMFTGQQTWGQLMQATSQPGEFVPRTEKRLSHSVDNLVGGSVSLGVGFPTLFATGSLGGDFGTSAADLAFLGVSGQGLPDQFDTRMLSQNNLLFAPPNAHFSAIALSGLQDLNGLGATDRWGFTAGGNVSALDTGGFGLGLSYARHVQNEYKIVTDMNGDGFPDIAYQSGNSIYVYINDGARNFTQKEWTDYGLQNSNFSTADRITDPNVASATFKTDPLVRWVAPFTGTVTINSSATVGNQYDPVRVDLYVDDDGVQSQTIPAGGGSRTLRSNYSRMLNAGEKVYLRAAGLGDHPGTNSISFPTSIVYTPPAGRNASELDPNGSLIFTYKPDFDFRYGGEPRVPWHLTSFGNGGNVGVARCFSKAPTPDEIKVSYVIRDKVGGFVKRFDLMTPATAGTTCFPNSVQFPLSSDPGMSMINGVTQDHSLGLEYTSDSPVGFLGVINPVMPANGHAMMYTRYCRLSLSDCGAPQWTGSGYAIPLDPFATSFPVPTADIVHDFPAYQQVRVWKTFNNGTTTTPQPIRSVPAPSSSVTFGGTVRTNATLTEDVVVLIQGVNKLFAKRVIPAGTASGMTFPVTTHSCNVNSDCAAGRTCTGTAPTRQCTGAATVQSGEPIFFTIYSPGIVGGNVSWLSPTMNSTAVSSNNINNATRDALFDNNPPVGVATRDPMSGGFHNWFYGDWNESISFCDHLPVGMTCNNRIVRVSTPPQNNDAIMGAVPPLAHQPGTMAAWNGRGGAQMYSLGGNILMWPGQVNSPNGIATNATRMSALRVSDTWNLNLSANASNATAGLNGGDATTQVDFFDFNGDRFPDSITHGGIQLNNGDRDGERRFLARQPVDLSIGGGSTEIRRIQNVSLQAGATVSSAGSRQLINEVYGDGETKKISTTAALSGSADWGVSSTRIDFVDVNGDGLIDHVREEPNDTSQLKVRLNLGYGFSNEVSWLRTGTTTGWTQGNATVTAGWPELFDALDAVGVDPGTILNQVPVLSPSSTNVVRLQDTGTLSAVIGTSVGPIGGGGGPTYSVTRTWVDMIDVNGDGLPDQVLKKPGDPQLRVKLNMGDRFAPEQPWSLPAWTTSPGNDYSFLAPDGVAFSTVDGWGKNFSLQICVVFCVGTSGFESQSKGGPSMQFDDVDGDGDLDQVMKVPGDEHVYVKFNKVVNTDATGGNKVGPPNLLTAVNRPLGGRFDISYERSGNHVEMMANPKINMPSNQWVMSRVVLNADKRQACPTADCTTEDFKYSNWQGYGSGFYDKTERENLGYGIVKTIFPLETVAAPTIEVNYHNQNYYLRGLETFKSWIQDSTNSFLLKKTEQRYFDPSGKSPAQELERTGSFFPAPMYSFETSYEGGFSGLTHPVTRTFDANGNLTDVVDYGTDQHQDPNDDFNYHIDYASPGPNITAAKTITARTGQVAGAGTLLAKRTVDTFFPTGKPNTVTDVIVGGKHPSTGVVRTEGSANATWTFTYDAFGNVETAQSPNSASDPDGNARKLKYTYDTATRTYPETTAQDEPLAADADKRYTATAVYDAKFGLPTRITDVAGARQEIDYDAYGRITKVWAPTDFTNGVRNNTPPTIAVTYSQVAHTAGATEPVPAWAMATHRSSAPPEGSVPGASVTPRDMRTVNFVDGLERSIQVKKDITRDDGSGTSTASMSVSGKTIFDARGRLYQQGQPTFTGTATPTAFVPVTMTNQTEYSYDVLSRLRRELHSDNGTQAATFISYQMGSSPTNGLWYQKKVTADPLYSLDQTYHHRTEYLNARGEVTLVAERNSINWNPTDLYTMYDYDPLGRVVRVMDTKGFPTSAKYDTVGNLVELTSPDAGIREWRYCVGGYVCAEQSPKMRLAGSNVRIQHTYDRDRLMTTTYPNPNPTSADPIGNPGVTYVYGASTETGSGNFYKANRVKQRTDEAGRFDYEYDALGNVSKETAALKRTGLPDYPSYATQYKWDSFGRLIDVTIPGTTSLSTPGETIRYGYDAGGAVASAIGKLTTTAGTTFPYVKHVGYNEFGERVRILYGNDAFTTYGYAADTRRLTNVNTTITDVGGQRLAQALVYHYNLVGNVVDRLQSLPLDAAATAVPVGGISNQWFSYDPLNQLTGADFYARGKVTEQVRGSVRLDYDEIGNITQKVATDDGDTFDANGNWTGPFIGDQNYTFIPSYTGTAAGASPHAPSNISEERGGFISFRDLSYDSDGNATRLVYGTTGRGITWTETDRVRSICNGTPGVTCQTIAEARYAADGTRTHNKVTTSGTTETLYVNQYLTVRNGTIPTKHVYLGDARIASKVETNSTNNARYWYHSDHIQSTQYVTTSATGGQSPLVQHLEFFPGGEVWREENDTSSSRLRWPETSHATTFTGKEMDPSGYYYFGARYYEPEIQMWLSPDPILASYMRGHVNDGVFQPRNLGLYTYAWNNPVILKDPDGRVVATAIGCVAIPGAGCAAGAVIDVAIAGTAMAGAGAAIGLAGGGRQTNSQFGGPMDSRWFSAKGRAEIREEAERNKPLLNENKAAAGDGPTVNTAGRGTKKNPATTEDVLTEKLNGRKPTAKEVENYENDLRQEAARSGHGSAETARSDRPATPTTEHKKGERGSTAEDHERGQARVGRDAPGGEKGDARRRY